MIAPSTPRKTLVAALIAASMDPLAIGLAYLRGLHVPSFTELIALYSPNYIAAAIAIVIIVRVTTTEPDTTAVVKPALRRSRRGCGRFSRHGKLSAR